ERLARQEAALTQVTGERDDLRRQLTAHREDQEKAQDAVRDLTGKLKRQAEAMTTAQAQASLTTENLERERNLRQKLEKEFERLEGQLDLLRDFLLPRRGGE